jgi:AraC-like DNA-binding protein
MSVTGSTRHWTEVHTQVCMAYIRPEQPGVEAVWHTRARTLTTRAAGLMLIEPGDVHVTQAVSQPADFDVVRFVPEVLDDAMRELELPGAFHFRSPGSTNPNVAALIGTLVDAHSNGDGPFELAALAAELVSLMVSELGERPSDSGIILDPVRDFRLRRACEYLRSHLEQKPTLDELAAELKLSKFRLCAIFKSAYGVSVGQYWMAARIAAASHELLTGAPIKLVAARLGFADEAYFTRVFRAHRGMPPGAWLRLQRKNSVRASGEPLRRAPLRRARLGAA